VVGSEALEEVSLGFNELSKPWTNFSDWDARLVSSVCDDDVALFKSPLTVVKADWAVARSPEVSALPSAARSVESGELFEALLPLAVVRFWFSRCKEWNADWAPVRSPNARLFCKVCNVCCSWVELLDAKTY
jgi:hypothetical protein